jgi:tRNA G18 (ribose-2'-O)-methylase SpoU
MEQIDAIDSPLLDDFRSLKSKKLLAEGLFIADSEKVVDLLLTSGIEILQVFGRKEAIKARQFDPRTQCLWASDLVCQKVVGYRLHHGLMAKAKVPKASSLTELEETIVVFNGVTSPENIGTIIRTCRAFKINSVIIDQKSAHPYLRRCVRVSMGHVFGIHFHESKNLLKTLSDLKQLNYQILAAAKNKKAHDFQGFPLSKKRVLILGSEGHGIDSQILGFSDAILEVPIDSQVDSLNVASAAAILLHRLSL